MGEAYFQGVGNPFKIPSGRWDSRYPKVKAAGGTPAGIGLARSRSLPGATLASASSKKALVHGHPARAGGADPSQGANCSGSRRPEQHHATLAPQGGAVGDGGQGPGAGSEGSPCAGPATRAHGGRLLRLHPRPWRCAYI